MGEIDHSDYSLFETRSGWHNALFINLGMILLCVYLSGCYLHTYRYGIALAIPLLTFTIFSDFFSFERCPKEILVFDNMMTVWSLILIVLLTLLTSQIIKWPWYLFLALYSSILFVGSPSIKDDETERNASVSESPTSRPSISPIDSLLENAQTSNSISQEKQEDNDIEISIIVGLLDGYSEKATLTHNNGQNTTISFSGKTIATIEKKDDHIAVSVFLKTGNVSFTLPSGKALSHYREVLYSCGCLIKEQYHL